MRVVTAADDGRSVERVIATWYRVGGTTTAEPLRVKLATTEARLLGGDQTAVAIHASAIVRAGRGPRTAIARFMAALGPIDGVCERMLGR